MFDKAQIAALRPILLAGFALMGHEEISVKQRYQPTTQGVDTGPTLYFDKIGDHFYGLPKQSDVINDAGTAYIRTTLQFVETSWQATGIFKQDPTLEDTAGLTAADVGSMAVFILGLQETRAALKAAGLSVLRVKQARNLKVVTGAEQWEAIPSFDFVVLHEQATVTTTPIASVKNFGIKRV